VSRIFLEGEKAYFSRFVEVLGSQRGIPKGPKKSEIPEWREGERRGLRFWNSEGMGD